MQRRYVMSLLATAFLTICSVSVAPPAHAAVNGRDCDANAIMYCGGLTKAELLHKYDVGDGKHSAAELDNLYTQAGISRAEIASSATANGTLTRDGRVIVNGKTVATNAVSWGRQPISGSTKDGNLYRSPDQTAFLSDNLAAYVYMPNGRFAWAIIAACGNMAKATPVPVPKPAQPAVVTPIATVPQQPAPLPATGAAAGLVGLGGVSAIGYASRAYVLSRRRLRRSLSNTRP